MARATSICTRFAAAVSILLFSALGFAQSANPRSRIVTAIDECNLVTIAGNTLPLARPEFDQGAIDPATRLDRLVLVLKRSAAQQRELDVLVEAQNTPGSPLFHRWLTPAEYGQRFGVSPADLGKIAAWLGGHGFTVEPAPAGRNALVFSGNAAQVAETFHTEIHRYSANGTTHIANALDPQIPAALSPVVEGVLSLNDVRRQPQIRFIRPLLPRETAGHSEASRPELTSGGSHYLMPADYATIYDLSPLYDAGVTGGGASIAIPGRSDIYLSDVSSFRSNAGLPTNQPTVIHSGTDPGVNDTYGDQDESTLDVEWSGAVGYGATVKFVVAASTSTTDGIDLALQYIVNDVVSPVMSTSYGLCEADMGSSENAFYNSLWEQAASEGISALVSAGDSGAAGCDSGSSSSGSGAGVNGMCSSPYSTCVGGTEFNEESGTYWSGSNSTYGGSALSYIPEKVWNESALDGGSGLWAGGGGVSEVYSQPSWQAGVTGSAANGMRTVPDVSLTASGHDGYIIVENGSEYVIGGTSAASPSFAGILSLVVEGQNGKAQGNVNSNLYSLLNASQSPFHPTLTGNNSVPGVTGFTATGAAYNLATGLGSVDGNLLASAWSGGGSGNQPALVLTPSSSSISLLPGAKTSFVLSVSATGNLSGQVALSATAPSGVTVTFSSSSVAIGSSVTVSVTAASTASSGTGNIAITGTSGSLTQTLDEALTISSPTLTLTTGVSSVSALEGGTATFSVAVTAASGYTTPVLLSATAPSGVSVSFKPTSVAPGATSIATVNATTAATAGTGTIAITGTSGTLTATANESLTVVAPSPTITPNSSSVSVFPGQTATFTVTVGAATGYTTPISLSATAPTGVSVAFSPSSVTPGATATATVNASTAAIAGTGTITINGTSGAWTATATEPLTVNAPAITLTPNESGVTATLGKSATFTITVGAASGFTNSIVLSATAPTGVNVSFSPATVKPGATATATVYATTAASAGTGTITITGTSGQATATASEALTVVAAASAATAKARIGANRPNRSSRLVSTNPGFDERYQGEPLIENNLRIRSEIGIGKWACRT